MGLTEELIKYCRKFLGELARIIDGTHEELLDEHKAEGLWQKWQESLDYRLRRLGIPSVQSSPAWQLMPFAGLEPALKSVQRLADGDSLEALQALCELAIFSAKAVRTIRRAQYVREHPYPWHKEAGSSAPEEVPDSEVSKMLGELGDIPLDEHD